MKKIHKLFSIIIILMLFVPPVYAEITEEQESELAKDSTTEINVKDADLLSLIRIFSKKTKRNYILDERVKGKVSIYLPGKVSSEEAIHVLDSVLALKGFTSVPIGDNLWKVVSMKDAQQTTIPLVGDTEGRGAAVVVTKFLHLKHVSADDVKQLLQPLVSSTGLINAYTGTNSLIIIDLEENIQRLNKIIEMIDIPYTDRDMTIIPIKHADAPDIADKINQILLEKDDKSSNNTNSRNVNIRNTTNRRTASTQATTTALTVSARALEPKIIADERTNSIIVVADDTTTARIQALVEQLDSPVDLSGDRFYVYHCQHANAEDLGEVLSGLVDGNKSTSGDSNRVTGSSLNRRVQTQRAGNTESTGNNIASISFGENVSVTADPSTNSLIIVGSKTDYEKIKELLKELDIKRRQVLVEAVLLEVGIDENTTLRSEFISSWGGSDGGILALNNSGGLTNLLSDPTSISQFSVAVASSGSLTLPGNNTIPSQSLLVTAAKTNSNVNVLSAPTILATDNEEAEIIVGQNVPFLTSTASSQDNLNNVFNQIDRQDVGITLRLTPQISSSDFVNLKLFTEVSNVIAGTQTSNLGPTTTVRTSSTTVITKNNQMVVIGGLMSDDITESDSGVPFLQDIPVIGHLFKDDSERLRKTNLLIFITPRILEDQYDAREMTIKNRNSLTEEIRNRKMYPARQEFLNSKDIDNVAEAKLYKGEKPGTILPPIKKKKTINLKVKPKFKQQEVSTEKGSYAVLKLNKGNKDLSYLPFNMGNKDTVTVVVPEDSHQKAKEFFSKGNSYEYNGIAFTVLGKYSSPKAVEASHPKNSKSFYLLSPYEIINLGNGPWRKK